MLTTQGANVTEPIKSVSAVKKYPRAATSKDNARARGRRIWKDLADHGDDMVRLGQITKETRSVITRFVLFGHLTQIEGEAAKRYAYIVARFEKYCIPTKRDAKSPSYEKAFGSDQELERRERNGTMADYEDAAKDARRQYNKLIKVLGAYGSQTKSVLDDFCLSDVEPATEFRPNLAIVLRVVAKAFGVTAKPRLKRKVRR